jgi:hypothetical protein
VSGLVSLEIAPPSGVCRVDTLGAGDEMGWSSVIGEDTVFQGRVLQDLHALAFDAAALRALCDEDTVRLPLMRRVLGWWSIACRPRLPRHGLLLAGGSRG